MFDNELLEFENEIQFVFDDLVESASRLQSSYGKENYQYKYFMDCASLYNLVRDIFELFSNDYFNDYVQELFTVKGISNMVKSKEIATKFPVLTAYLLRYIQGLREINFVFPGVIFSDGSLYFNEYMLYEGSELYFYFTKELKNSNINFNFEVYTEVDDFERASYDEDIKFYMDSNNRIHVTLPVCVKHLCETGILATFVMIDRLKLEFGSLISDELHLKFPNMADWSCISNDIVKKYGEFYEDCHFQVYEDTLEKVMGDDVIEQESANGYLYDLVRMILGHSPELYNNDEIRLDFEKRVLRLRYNIRNEWR